MNKLLESSKKNITLVLVSLLLFILILNSIFNNFVKNPPLENQSEQKYYSLNNSDIFFVGVVKNNDELYYLLFIKNWSKNIYNFENNIIFQEKENNLFKTKKIIDEQGIYVIKRKNISNHVLSKLIIKEENSEGNFYFEERNIKEFKLDKNYKNLKIYILNNVIKFENKNIGILKKKIDRLNKEKNKIEIKIKEIKKLSNLYEIPTELKDKIIDYNNKIVDENNYIIDIKNYLEVLKSQKYFYETGKKIKPKKIKKLKYDEFKKININDEKKNNKNKLINEKKQTKNLKKIIDDSKKKEETKTEKKKEIITPKKKKIEEKTRIQKSKNSNNIIKKNHKKNITLNP